MTTDLRYPVGKYAWKGALDAGRRAACLDEIARLPERARAAVSGLTPAQLDTPYRDDGWTVRQVIHHIADSHLNAYIRMKLAVTEDHPTVKTYEEKDWAELSDARKAPIEISLALLDALHQRLDTWLRALDAPAYARTAQHAEWGKISVDFLVDLYAWHCRHHVAHITGLRQRNGW